MKFLFAVLAVVGTGSLWEANAKFYDFSEVTRTETESTENDVLTVAKNNWGNDELTILQDELSTLLITPTVTSIDTGDIVYSGGPLDLCNNDYAQDSWEKFTIRLFQIIVPRRGRGGTKKCPLKGSAELHDEYGSYGANIDGQLDKGRYEVSYTADSPDNVPVLSSVKFTLRAY